VAVNYRKIEVIAVTPEELGRWMDISEADVKAEFDRFRNRRLYFPGLCLAWLHLCPAVKTMSQIFQHARDLTRLSYGAYRKDLFD
jgi:hypothetical protein